MTSTHGILKTISQENKMNRAAADQWRQIFPPRPLREKPVPKHKYLHHRYACPPSEKNTPNPHQMRELRG